MRKIEDVQRGCGTLKPGGFYAQATSSRSGILGMWSWLLGSMWSQGLPHNLLWTVPPRAMQLIHLPHSIVRKTVVLSSQAFDTKPIHKDSMAWNLPTLALLDHVGSNNYTPYSFAQEVIAHGPSRRIPEQVARQIAGLTPVPIIFSHEWMPLSDTNECKALQQWASVPAYGNFFGATWEREGYGFTTRDQYHGEDHWSIPVMCEMDRASKGRVVPLHKIMPHPLDEQVITTEQPFGVSWITKVTYITTGSESADELDSLSNLGIEPVSIEKEQ